MTTSESSPGAASRDNSESDDADVPADVQAARGDDAEGAVGSDAPVESDADSAG